MKITKTQLKRIIKEEKRQIDFPRAHARSKRINVESSLMAELDNIAVGMESLAKEVYGMSGPGTVSGDEGDELARDLEMQIERLNTFYDKMVSHFESMDPESQSSPNKLHPSYAKGQGGQAWTKGDPQ